VARRRNIPWGLWLGCLLAALLAHALLVVPGTRVLARSLGAGFEASAEDEQMIELSLLEPSEPEQFVEIDEANDRPPVESKRIASRNSAVERETKAPTQPEGGAPNQPDTSDAGEPQTGHDDLVAAEDGSEAGATTAEPAVDLGKLGGSKSALRETLGARSSPDHLPVEPGRETLLDSKEHLFSSFFSRMRGRILEHWNPKAAVKRHDPQGAALGSTVKTTTLSVHVARDGSIDALAVARGSGVDYLDAEAIRTLKAAGPFPNPPAGLFGDDETFVMTVVFAVDPDGSTRVFRKGR
jgi:TonB family protein